MKSSTKYLYSCTLSRLGNVEWTMTIGGGDLAGTLSACSSTGIRGEPAVAEFQVEGKMLRNAPLAVYYVKRMAYYKSGK